MFFLSVGRRGPRFSRFGPLAELAPAASGAACKPAPGLLLWPTGPRVGDAVKLEKPRFYESFAGVGLAQLGLERHVMCTWANDVDSRKRDGYVAKARSGHFVGSWPNGVPNTGFRRFWLLKTS